MIISSQTKMAAFCSLLQASYLRGTFSQNLEFGFRYPKVIPYLLTSLPQTQKCLNLRILVWMFQSSGQTKVFWMYDMEMVRSYQIQENSKFLKKDMENLFERIAYKEKIQIQIHDTVFPDNQPSVFGPPINHKSCYFINIEILLKEEFLQINICQIKGIGRLIIYLNQVLKELIRLLAGRKTFSDEETELHNIRIKGLGPISTSQFNGKLDSFISSIGKQTISQILEEKQFIIKPTQMEQDQQKNPCLASSRQLIIDKLGEYSSIYQDEQSMRMVLQQMEMEQHLQEINQQFKQLPKIKKTVKDSKKNTKKLIRRSE